MNAREKLYFLLNRIDEKRTVTLEGRAIVISLTDDLNRKFSAEEARLYFQKLEKDEKVLQIVDKRGKHKVPLSVYNDQYYIRLTAKFDDYFFSIKLEPEYQNFTGFKPTPQMYLDQIQKVFSAPEIQKLYDKIAKLDEQITIRRKALAQARLNINDNPYYSEATRVGQIAKLEEQAQTDIGNFLKEKEAYMEELNMKKVDAERKADLLQQKFSMTNPAPEENNSNKTTTSQPVLKITYTKSREILLNNLFQLAKPDFDSENDVVFEFLYKNANTRHSKEEIEASIGRKINKPLHKIVENLGFTSDIKKVFISVNKDSICFNNPITQEDLDRYGIKQLKLPK